MSQAKVNVLLAIAMLAGASSLPMDWFTLTGVVIEDAVFAGSVSALQGATLFSIPVSVLVAIARAERNPSGRATGCCCAAVAVQCRRLDCR